MSLKAERAHEIFRYDQETGALFWRVQRGRQKAGGIASTVNKDGYLQVCCDGKTYLAHRVIFLMQVGRWPTPTIDHLDRNKTNNRWHNLREATHRENLLNRSPATRSQTPGVIKLRTTGRYLAQSGIVGGRKKLGTYDTLEQAQQAIRDHKARRRA